MRMNSIVLLFRGTLLALFMTFLFACTGQNGRSVTQSIEEQNDSQGAYSQANIAFDTLYHDFGTIIEGEMVVCYFEYENQGKGDLLITSVESTCGCTTPDWNKKPLKPGDRSQLKVVFNAQGRSGAQLKSIAVVSNSETEVVRLSIRANVINNK